MNTKTDNQNDNCIYQSKIKIPTREEFHKQFAGVLSTTNFCTCAPQNHKTIYYTTAELENRRIHKERNYESLRQDNKTS